jgi:hypothetical protein
MGTVWVWSVHDPVEPAVPRTVPATVQVSAVGDNAEVVPVYKVIETVPSCCRTTDPNEPATIEKFMLDAVQVAGAILPPPAAVGEVVAAEPLKNGAA